MSDLPTVSAAPARAAPPPAGPVARAHLSAWTGDDSPPPHAGRAGDLVVLWVERGWVEATVAGRVHSLPAGWWAVGGGGEKPELRSAARNPRVHLLVVPAEWCAGAPLGARFTAAARRGLVSAESPHGMELSRWWRSWEIPGVSGDRGWQDVLRHEALALLLRFEKSLPVARLLEAVADRADAALPPRAAGRGFGRADELVRHLHEHQRQRLSVTAACRAVGLHPVYGASLFKQATGFTILDYLRRLRVNRACELLASTDLKIADVGTQAGFSTTSRFYEAFAKLAGCRPQEFRRKARAGPRSAGLAVDFLAGRDRLRRFEPAPVGREAGTRRRFPMVLWVDDQPANNFTERLFFHEIGIFVDCRADTAEALAALADLRHDVVITDLSRPGGREAGLDLLRELRARGGATPVLLYTATAAPELQAAFAAGGGQGVFDRSRPLVEKTLELLLHDAAFVESPVPAGGNGSTTL